MSQPAAPALLQQEGSIDLLLQGAAQVLSREEMVKKLALNRPLRVKLGVDPTAPDIHLGHTVGLRKLRQFQDLGHDAILIIGDFTAMIGDPSGRSVTRPQLTHDQVMHNARSYQEQAFKILDPHRTRTVFNGEWFEMMHFEEVIRLNSRVTLQQMLQREDFRERIEQGHPIHAHEIQYPIMQGWDSVMVKADVEIGGTDQLFNILVGRDLQKEEGQPQQVALMMPIIEGLDGVQKMSKSLNNYVAINEPSLQMFGKLMSIPDSLMERFYLLLLGEQMPDGLHPMEAKKRLAAGIVASFHSQVEARAALDDWNVRFTERRLEDAELPEFRPQPDQPGDLVSIVCQCYLTVFELEKSRSDARRLVEQGSVQWQGEKLKDPKSQPDFRGGGILRLDKTRAVRILPA